jgi:hypothetical protein
MKKIFILCFICVATLANAQITTDTVIAESSPYDVKPSKESMAYSVYRVYANEPTYSLAKVKAAIKKAKKDEDGGQVVSKKVWDAFTSKEKFTYCMINPESFSQNCDAMPPIEDEHKKIFPNLPDANFEADLSERQTIFLKKNKDSVIAWIKESANAKKRIGVNFKEVLVNINAKQAIPYLIEFYNKTKKDHDILTILILLMKEGKYAPFLKSQMYEKLYGPEATWLANINANKANQELIIKRASDFYNGK